jgi:peptidoglycan-associated lipoprotein
VAKIRKLYEVVMITLSKRVALLAALALVVAACSKDADDANNEFGRNGTAKPGTAQDFQVNVGDRVFFDEDSSELTGQGRATLDKQSQWLQKYSSFSFTVEGHADERGTGDYNFGLGNRRAQTVRDYLAAKGLTGSRIRTTSYGKERPVATCNDASCWNQNRRAVTVLGQ